MGISISKLLGILNLREEEKQQMLEDNPALEKYLPETIERKPKRLNTDLAKKIGDDTATNCEAYLEIKSDIKNILQATYLSDMDRIEYLSQLEDAQREKDPAEYFNKISRICEEVRMRIAYEIGRNSLKNIDDSSMAEEEKRERYIRNGLRLIEEFKDIP